VASDPLVDVLLPTYCGGRFVREAIDSVLAQSHRDVHLIVVDDASPDATLDLVREHLAGRDERVTLLPLASRGGAPAARMAGLARARGALLAFVDQDDRWHPRKLERQLARLRRDPGLSVVHTDIAIIDAEGRPRPGAADAENAYRARVGYAQLSRDALLRECFRRTSVRLVSALVRREAFAAVGGFALDHFGGEDWALWVELAAAGHRFDHVAEPLVERRLHGGNVSIVEAARRREGHFAAITEMVRRHPALAALADPLRASLLRSEILLELSRGRGGSVRPQLRQLRALRPGALEPLALELLCASGPLQIPLFRALERGLANWRRWRRG
jgi:glycosyltransferase involved in cell wall biosynthesis